MFIRDWFASKTQPNAFKAVSADEQQFDTRTAYTHPTPAVDTSGFKDAPRGRYAGQTTEFQRQYMRQLAKDQAVIVARGDARPLETLLKDGILPKKPGGSMNVENHRGCSSESGAVSFTTQMSVAVKAGANASEKSHYGSTPIPGNGRFTVVATELSGDEHDVAGPGRINSQENEATAAGPVAPKYILGYRQCSINPHTRVAACSPIYVRNYLDAQRRQQVTSLLSGQATAPVSRRN